MEYDIHILMEVAGQQGRGGADPALIREGVDYRQKFRLSDAELSAGLKRLHAAKLVQKQGDKYFIAEPIVPTLPRTATGKVSFSGRAWAKLQATLFKE